MIKILNVFVWSACNYTRLIALTNNLKIILMIPL
jgi:hypothetical protein